MNARAYGALTGSWALRGGGLVVYHKGVGEGDVPDLIGTGFIMEIVCLNGNPHPKSHRTRF